MKTLILLRGGPFDGQYAGIEDEVTQVRWIKNKAYKYSGETNANGIRIFGYNEELTEHRKSQGHGRILRRPPAKN